LKKIVSNQITFVMLYNMEKNSILYIGVF
jgi:hypothetical protein